uniref:RAMP superfamily CRISPR-associated protein n=1 Tax=uncultured Chloroflexus sp. TaxID=214040 RepID=UPI00262A82E4
MPRDKAPTGPKPFFWITLGKQAPRKEQPSAHDRFRDWSGRLKLEIEVVSEYLYVGSGNFELFHLNGGEQAYYAFARHNGQLVIPGTGIKGAVRSIVEAISNSCVHQVAKGERAPGHEACRDANTLCPACRLFGTTGYGGRVHFSDAVPIGQVETEKIKIADLWPPRPPRQAGGRKFYYAKSFQPLDMKPEKSHRFIEVVSKGSKFAATLYFENLSTAEMGLLVRAIGLDFSRQDPSKVVY